MLKYGTVAVKLKDHAPVAVARIESTEAYKNLMRMTGAPESTESLEDSTWCSLYHPLIPLSVQGYLDFCPQHPDVDAVQTLLYALKRAAEEYLGHVVCLINISLLDPAATEGRLEQAIDAALSNLGLTQALPIKPSAYALALQHEGLYVAEEEPFPLMLVIESDTSGVINLDLPLLDDSGSMNIRRHHNVSGTAIPPECLKEDKPTSCASLLSQRRESIHNVLKNITTPPFGELPWAGEMPTAISRVLIYGDAADAAALYEELRALFGPNLPAETIAQPAYAAALGGAKLAFFRINDVTYHGKASSWCCLRSWGKACPRSGQRIDL